MDMLINFIVLVILQCICISNITLCTVNICSIYFVNYSSIKLKKKYTTFSAKNINEKIVWCYGMNGHIGEEMAHTYMIHTYEYTHALNVYVYAHIFINICR